MSEQEASGRSSSKDISARMPWWVRLCRWLWKIAASFVGLSILLSLGINVLSTWLTSSKGIIPTDSPFAWLIARWPIILLIGCCFLLIALLTWVLSRWPAQNVVSPLRAQQNRVRMLHRLRHSYSDILVESLQGVAWMELGFTHQPDAVQNAATLLLRLAHRAERLLPPGTSITQVYEEAAHELLILGEPGAGKSTLLLTLAQQLVVQAEQEDTQPLPVLLPLSTWADNRPPLHDWIAEQVTLIYDIPKQLVRHWVQEEQFLLLLDGLDEMEEAARPACITAINTYHHAHPGPLVVCSRRAEYENAARNQRLTLQSAVVVQSLSHRQVNAYLVQAGKPLEALRRVLNKNPTLQDLATIPLMLSVLVLAYKGITVHNLPQKEAELQQQVWTDYVQRMVGRKGDSESYPLEQTYVWLRWLAYEMRAHNQTIFFLEQLQPDWLPTRRRTSYRLSGLLLSGLLGGLFFGLLGGLPVRLRGGLGDELLGVLLISLPAGLLVGLKEKIEPTEALVWSWEYVKSGLLVGLLVGLLAGLFFGLVSGLLVGLFFGLVSGLLIGLFIGLFGGQIFALVGRPSKKQLTEHHTLSPNEGIQRSVMNGLLVGLVGGLFFGPLSGLLSGLFYGQPFGLLSGQYYGLVGGLLGGLFFGQLGGLLGGLGAVTQHYILRFWLWRTHTFPWKIVPFLDDATTRILLRRVGGGYSFIHRLLLDYFADVDTTIPSTLKAVHIAQSPPP